MQVNHLTSRFVYPSVFVFFSLQTELLPNLSTSFCYLNLISLALIGVWICGRKKIECFSSFAGGSLLLKESCSNQRVSCIQSSNSRYQFILATEIPNILALSVVQLCKRYRFIELFFYMHTCKWFILVLPAWLAGQEMTHRQLTLWWLQCILD